MNQFGNPSDVAVFRNRNDRADSGVDVGAISMSYL